MAANGPGRGGGAAQMLHFQVVAALNRPGKEQMGRKSTTRPLTHKAPLVPYWGRLLASIVFCISVGVLMVAVAALLDTSHETAEKLYFVGIGAGLVLLTCAGRMNVVIPARS